MAILETTLINSNFGNTSLNLEIDGYLTLSYINTLLTNQRLEFTNAIQNDIIQAIVSFSGMGKSKKYQQYICHL